MWGAMFICGMAIVVVVLTKQITKEIREWNELSESK